MLAITFSVGPMRFALPAAQVVQIVPRVPLHQVAGAVAELAGLLELANQIVPVVDLGQRLRGEPCADRLSTRIIVANARHQTDSDYRLGLIAENVTDLQNVEVDASIGVGEPGLEEAIGGIARARGELLHWIDVSRILTSEERSRVYRGILARHT
jgi:chemotaxis-related protein WspB